MKIFPAEMVREIDQYTIENEPIASSDLMERAASRFVEWYVKNYQINRKVKIFAGPGNNGGDAIAVARLLAERQYSVDCYLVSTFGKYSKDCQLNIYKLEKQGLVILNAIQSISDFPSFDKDSVVIDGLFGSGLTRKLDGLYKDLVAHINGSSAEIISIDIPSGLFGEDNSSNDADSIIRARTTLTFQFPFLSFFFQENEIFTGKWNVLDIGLSQEIIDKLETHYTFTERRLLSGILPARAKFSHKGSYGHALLVAGSYGMMGAALLAGEAVLRSGAGLLSIHAPRCGYGIIQGYLPEAIVNIDSSEDIISSVPALEKYSAIAIGPGIGKGELTVKALKELLVKANKPLVIDADALNILAENPSLLEHIPERSILTPHPIELDRLLGKSESNWERHLKQKTFSYSKKLILILKGAYTGIAFPDGKYLFNTSGNPGMASGGSGDVLTGIVVSLLAQGIRPEEAATLGVYVHGMAGDIAAEELGEEAMISGDIIKYLGLAFKKLKAKPFLHEGRTGGARQ